MTRGPKGTKIKENIAALKAIKVLADQNHINLIVYIAPHNQNMMDTFHHESYLLYLEEIAKIVDYWDFSGYNTVSLNNHYYYESSHYRDELAKLVVKRIFNDNLSSIPSDFGQYVTAKNAQAHLIQRNQSLLSRDNITQVKLN